MDCVLFHVKFEGGLTCPVLKNRGTLYEKVRVQNQRVF